jgi:hypothetical protein
MKLSGHACTEAMNEAEEARRRERTEDSAGGVRVERRVRRGRRCIPLLVKTEVGGITGYLELEFFVCLNCEGRSGRVGLPVGTVRKLDQKCS